jgi:hypothetical protein
MHPSTLRPPDPPVCKKMEEVDGFVFDTDDIFFDGIDPRVMSMFDLYAPGSAPTPRDDLDHQVKTISTASIGLLDSNEA